MKLKRSILLVLITLTTIACTGTPPGPAASPWSPIWIAGDSISVRTAAFTHPKRYAAGVVGAGFVNSYGPTATILTNTQTALATYGTPPRLLIIGGTNDHDIDPTVTIAAMETTKATLEATGARITWVTEPRWADYDTMLAPLDAWVNAQPDHIDCAPAAEGPGYDSGDHIHPNVAGYIAYAACIDAALVTAG